MRGPRGDFERKLIAKKGRREGEKDGEGTKLTSAKNERRKCVYLRENEEEIEEGEEIERDEGEKKLDSNRGG